MYADEVHADQGIYGQVFAHRGLWTEPKDANSPGALRSALEMGFCIEVDLRDLHGQIVVSHDPPGIDCSNFLRLLEEWKRDGLLGPGLALNIKADGLSKLLEPARSLLNQFPYFYFDMSLPDTLSYIEAAWPIALRISEFEPFPTALVGNYHLSNRFWLDGFESEWWVDSPMVHELSEYSQLIVVSPELHGREPRQAWEWVKERKMQGCNIYICTDYPLEFVEFLK